jgi:nitrite reductase (NADH) small subunit
VTFSVAGRGNCAVVDGQPYVYARTSQGSFVMRARCGHRGGPLHLATLDTQADRLVCPWHERGTSLQWLRQQIPAVRRGEVVTAVLPGPPGAEVGTGHRPLSADLAG